MLVLEEKELVCVEVKREGKKWRDRKGVGGLRKNRGKMSVAGKKKKKCGFASVCLHAHLCAWRADVLRSKIEIEGERGKARLLHAGRDDAKSADCYKSVTAGPLQTIPSPGNADQSGFK